MRLENEYLIATFVAKGAQMSRLISKVTNLEYIWQADSRFWGYHNPTLFPIVGSAFNHTLLIDDVEYKMKQHGFARNFHFECVDSDDLGCTFRLSDNEETLKQYPFRFTLLIRYTLVGKRILIDYRIENKSDRTIPFQFGLHPAFNVPMNVKKTLDDYRIEFHPPCDLKFYGEDLFIKSTSSIPLSDAMFEERPTWLFEDVVAPYVSLSDGDNGVKVSCVGYRWLALWKPLGAPFICIEPWHGHGDFIKNSLPFEQREGTILLPIGKHWITSYTIEPF
ncbi:MAG: aldose 1-epimerase family protein [Erysipelotrichaceae bacterium]|nr:aldose 1-epimerase family protein [Erysipelotrichaceae bacterium]